MADSKEVLNAKFEMKTKEINSLMTALGTFREACDSIERQIQNATNEKIQIMNELINASEEV